MIEDVDLENDLIHIRPNSARRLKTRNSERTLPLVEYARSAMEVALGQSDGEWLYPRYIKDGKCYATHASNAVNVSQSVESSDLPLLLIPNSPILAEFKYTLW